MKTTRAFLSLLAAMMISLGAMAADDINYMFLDIKYADNGIDESYTESFMNESASIDVDGGGGFALLGSLAINDNWHAFAEYASTDVDLSVSATVDDVQESLKIGGDVDDWHIGVGFHAPLADNVHGIVQVGWEGRNVDFGSITILDDTTNLDIDDDGLDVMLGLRGNVSDNVELNGHMRYSQILGIDLAAEADDDALDDDILFGAGGIFHVNEMFSLGANIETGDSTAWNMFARFDFGS